MCLCAWECIFIYEQFWINNSNPALWSLTWKAFKIPRWFCLTLLVTKSLLWATWNTSWLKHCKFKKKSSPRTFFHCFCWAWGTAEERKRERETERERERNIQQLPPICAPIGHWTCNLGMSPGLGSNGVQPFSLWNGAPTNWAKLARTKSLWIS